jgi:hypothetical protein
MQNPDSRILAFAVRARWLGYAFVEGSCALVDWGMIFFRPTDPAQIQSAKRRTERLILHFSPSHIALSIPEATSSRNAPSNRSLVRAIRANASTQSVPVRACPRACLRHFFRDSGANSKDEIARAVAGLFPELKWSLPAKRRIWEKEHFRMTQFDAVAVGVACWRDLSQNEQECQIAG